MRYHIPHTRYHIPHTRYHVPHTRCYTSSYVQRIPVVIQVPNLSVSDTTILLTTSINFAIPT